MTITVDLATEAIRTGTGSPTTGNHGGAASGVKGVVIALMHGTSATDHISAVSYGGVALARKIRTTDTATEPGAAELWFLGAGVPQGTQTWSYTSGATTAAGCAFRNSVKLAIVLSRLPVNAKHRPRL